LKIIPSELYARLGETGPNENPIEAGVSGAERWEGAVSNEGIRETGEVSNENPVEEGASVASVKPNVNPVEEGLATIVTKNKFKKFETLKLLSFETLKL
jgi:hypothetical protein